MSGLLSFGHAAFFGWAAYISAHIIKFWGLPPIWDPPRHRDRGVIGLVLRLARHPPPRHLFRDGHLGAGADGLFRLRSMRPFTGGEDGIQAVPRGLFFGLIDLIHPFAMYYFVLAMFLAGFGIIFRTSIRRSARC